MIFTKSAALRLAPPTSRPSTSGWPISSSALSGLTDAAVEDPRLLGELLAVHRARQAADERVDLLGLLRGGRPAGADRPDRLVGDRHRRHPSALEALQAALRPAARRPARSCRRRAPPAARPTQRIGSSPPAEGLEHLAVDELVASRR